MIDLVPYRYAKVTRRLLRRHTAAAGCGHVPHIYHIQRVQREAWPTSRNHPVEGLLEATHMRSSGRAPTIRKRIEKRLLVHMQQEIISARPSSARGCLLAPRSRRALLPIRPLADEDESEGWKQHAHTETNHLTQCSASNVGHALSAVRVSMPAGCITCGAIGNVFLRFVAVCSRDEHFTPLF